MLSNLSPTDNLLLCCAKTQRNENIQNTICGLIDKKINWQKFLNKAIRLGIAPNCHFHLKETESNLPYEVKKTLSDIYLQNLARNMKLWAFLLKILRLFNQSGIDVIPLKGPILGDFIYGKIGMRTSGDLDILIQKQDYTQVKQLLAKIGYYPSQLPYSEEFIINFLRHRPFIKENTCPSHNPALEIHWNFYPQRPQEFDMMPVWKTALLKKIEDISFLLLSPSYILIHLSITLRIHGYLNFRHFSDIDALLINFKDKIDWEYTIKQAVINKQRTALYYALYFTKELLGTEIPPNVLKKIEPCWLRRKIVSFFLTPQKILLKNKNINPLFYSDFINLLTVDTIKDALKVSWMLLFSSSEDMIIRYRKQPLSEKSHRKPAILRCISLLWMFIKNLFTFLTK